MLCCGKAEKKTKTRQLVREELSANKRIDTVQRLDRRKDEDVMKLLLLGTGESGKSTLFKQIVHLYGTGFDRDMRSTYKRSVYTNLIQSIQTLVEQAGILAETCPEKDTEIPAGNERECEIVMSIPKSKSHITPLIAESIAHLWALPAIRNTFDARVAFQLADNVDYFFDKVHEIASPDYIPSYDDVLRCRARTTGVVETVFTVNETSFRLLDVGGQRNERKKWIHCFEMVTGVIFMAAINEYDQVLYEDGVTSRIAESLRLFDDICNSRWFRDSAIILFLNKKDLFCEKMTKVPLSTAFPEYTGTNTPEDAIPFMVEKFVSLNRSKDRPIYAHSTIATDSTYVDFAFKAVMHNLVHSKLQQAGLL